MATAGWRTAVDRSRTVLRRRTARWRSKRWMVAQSAVAAAVSWWLAADVLGHHEPVFAPIAAVISLGISYGQRLKRVVEVTLGVAIGVLLGDVLVSLLGNGAWQIGLIVGLGISAALLFNFGQLFVNQIAIQSIFIAVLVPGEGAALLRWTDALIGGAVALVAASVVPAAALRRPREQAAVVVRKISDLLRASAEVVARGERSERGYAVLDDARSTDGLIRELQAAADEGMSVVAVSPFHLRQRAQVQRMAELVDPLDRAMRTTRVIVRQAAIVGRHGITVPPSYAALLSDLADAAQTLADDFKANRVGEEARPALLVVGRSTAEVETCDVPIAWVILLQARSLVADLLVLTGLDQFQAADSMPPPPNLNDDEQPT